MTRQLESFKFLSQYFGNDPEKLTQVVKLAIQSVDGALIKIQDAIESDNIDLLRDGFHTLKGNLAHLELSELLKEMPSHKNPMVFQETTPYLERVKKEIDRIKGYLENDS